MLEKGTGTLLVGVAAPSEKNLVPWLMEHPSYQVYLHTKGGKSKSSYHCNTWKRMRFWLYMHVVLLPSMVFPECVV